MLRTVLFHRQQTVRPGALRAVRGFTLAELMVVVLIMGVLAAVGISSFWQHHLRSKNTQAIAVCRSIGAAQENYLALNNEYLNVSGNLNTNYPTTVPGQQLVEFWGQTGQPTFANWVDLAPVVPVYTRYAFATVSGLPGDPWPALGTTAAAPVWPVTNEPWYIVRGVGDLDGDGTNNIIILTSFNDRIYQENIGE